MDGGKITGDSETRDLGSCDGSDVSLGASILNFCTRHVVYRNILTLAIC